MKLKNYKIGFSVIGIVAVMLIMAPNIMYLFMTPPNDLLANNEAKYWLWNVLENIGRIGTIFSLCLICNKEIRRKNRTLDMVAACSLLVYYALWAVYFIGASNGLMIVGMAIFPVVFFILISLKLRNVIALAFSLLFAVFHIIITSVNFLF